MTLYTFRCERHGDFDVEQPMAETTRTHACPVSRCKRVALKVLSMRVNYPYGGRASFHDGPERDGRTVREVTQDWVKDWKDNGIKYEPVGTRWV